MTSEGAHNAAVYYLYHISTDICQLQMKLFRFRCYGIYKWKILKLITFFTSVDNFYVFSCPWARITKYLIGWRNDARWLTVAILFNFRLRGISPTIYSACWTTWAPEKIIVFPFICFDEMKHKSSNKIM